MADIPNPKWYDEGTVAITKGTTTVTGTNTFWVSAGVKAGDIFVDADKKIYEITAVNDSTSLTLGSSYTGETGSGKSYSIIRTFNATMTASLASQIATLLSEFEQRYDLDMQTITGKSAYDIAKDEGYTGTQSEWIESLSAYGVAVKNGYTGTVEEWIESLKAAGEWSELNARTSILTSTEAEVHNSIAGFRNKGTKLTDEQKTAIKNHTWEDMYIGDSWTLNGHTYRIAKFMNGILVNNFAILYKGIMMLSNVLYTAPMNETDTNEGGYANSWMYAEGLAQAGEIIAEDFGDLIMNFRERIYVGNTSGFCVSDNSHWQPPYKCMIPTYRLLTGRTFTGYPQDWYSYYQTHQIPLALYAANNENFLRGGNPFWLQECSNGTDSFLCWINRCVSGGQKASVQQGVRVIFFIG